MFHPKVGHRSIDFLPSGRWLKWENPFNSPTSAASFSPTMIFSVAALGKLEALSTKLWQSPPSATAFYCMVSGSRGNLLWQESAGSYSKCWAAGSLTVKRLAGRPIFEPSMANLNYISLWGSFPLAIQVPYCTPAATVKCPNISSYAYEPHFFSHFV